MTVIDTQVPADGDADKTATPAQTRTGRRVVAQLAEPREDDAPEPEDPFALDPLSPPSGRPW